MKSSTATTPPVREAPAGLRPMREDDLLSFVWIADPQISPDGRRVAFTRVWIDREADEYRTSLWWTEVENGTPRPLTNGQWDAQPRWSPDGTRIAFVRRTAADQPPQIHVIPVDGGEAIALTSLAKGASAPAWSPDGARIAFTSGTSPELDEPKQEKPKHEPGRIVTRPVFRENNAGFLTDFDHLDHVWVISAAGGTPRQLTRGDAPDGPPRWSRDGRRVRFVADRRDEPWFGHEESVLYAVDPDRATPADRADLETVVSYPGPIRAFAERDGGFALIGKPHGATFPSYDQMDVLEVATGATAPRTMNATRDHAFGEGVNSDQHPPRGGGELPFAFASDRRSVIALAARSGGAMLVRIDAATGAVTELTPRDRDVVTGTSTPDGRTWAITIGSVVTPGDLAVVDAERGTLRVLYEPNRELLAGVALGRVEEFRYPSFDGAEIHGWIVHPPGEPQGPAPTLIEIHGGPHSAYGFGFFHEFQLLAGAGYRVVYTNPRGSTSYGETFANCIQYRFPGDDARDLIAAIDLLLARGDADPARLGITGGSAGGLLTNWIIAHDHRFAGAITQRCVSDWTSMAASSDFAFFTPFWFRTQPWEDPAEWRETSPLFRVADIRTPLMVIHSEEDWRTPISQGEAMFRALLQQRKPAVMVRFPGENHELSRSGTPSRRVQNQEHIRAWFDRWLLGKPAPRYGF